MTSDASLGLCRAILKALKDDNRINSLLGPTGVICKSVNVTSVIENKQARPAIMMGPGTVRCWHSATFDGQEHALTLDVLCCDEDQAIRSLSSAIIERLHDADLPICGHALVSLEFECSETKPASSEYEGQDHCRMYFKALTISD